MRQSLLFTNVRKEAPADEVSVNAQLLIRGGYIHKEMAGVYAYLPLGLRVLRNIVQIIREEINAIDGQEVELTALQDKTHWQASNRWSDEVVDNWFKTALKNGTELGLAFTHEEPLTNIMKQHVSSYRDLPKYVYQFQTKFRNELRAKSGIMRGREFLMKDLYSFCRSESEHQEYYERSKAAYTNIFERVGLGDITYLTFASGGTFSKYSHEFQTITSAGEDSIFIDESKKIAINREVFNDEVIKDLGLNKNDLIEKKAVEVGNIFSLGTKFSSVLDLHFTAEDGSVSPVVMGSYGIGPGRVMGTIVETHHDDKGIIWPEAVSPFKFHLVNLNKDSVHSDSAYEALQKAGFEVLYDDRKESAGRKLAEAELLGMPYRLVTGQKTGDKVEYQLRSESQTQLLSIKEIIQKHVQ